MKAVLSSVVALVAVSGMPTRFPIPQHPFQPCDLIADRFEFNVEMQCCLPEVFGGCRAPPSMIMTPWGQSGLPQGYLPPPNFLSAVCCQKGKTCCVKDMAVRDLMYECCDEDKSCNIENKKGTCIDGKEGNGTTPNDVAHVDSFGRCPADGSLPLQLAPGRAIRCNLNTFINGGDCPSDSTCVRDNRENVNEGVCCRDSQCGKYNDCVSCVKDEEKHDAPCGWLTQGSLDDRQPRCVANCYNFGERSCILPSDGKLCPKSDVNVNGTIVNTGSCERRCNLVGTGRASKINNDGNKFVPVASGTDAPKKTTCCTKYPGDYCCSNWQTLAAHCAYGRTSGGPLCGVPIRGTEQQLYNPYGPSAVGGPYGAVSPYGPVSPYGAPIYGANPYAPVFGAGAFNGGIYGPTPYPMVTTPWMFNMYGRDGGDDKEVAKKQLNYFPSPMMYPPVAPMFAPRPQGPVPSIVDQAPSPFICSCDKDCELFNDCCSDYKKLCKDFATDAPTAAPSTAPTATP